LQHVAFGLLWLAWLAAPPGAAGEIFELENGGRVEGDILNTKESPRKRYIIKTTAGVEMTLEKSQVKKVIHRSEDEVEYEKVRAKYPDTVEGQWDLAEWCRERNLTRLRAQHLQRIIELDPDHEKARQALHYRRVGGEWKTRKQEMEELGYVSFKGKWRTNQEVAIIERLHKTDLAVKEWKGRLKRWRGWLDTGREAEAVEQIDGINDPFAVSALEMALTQDKVDSHRKRYINALARTDSPQGWRVLCLLAIEDDNEEIRMTCLEHLEQHPSQAFVDYFISRLGDASNPKVNRAADGLARMKSTAAVPALIEHLITKHKYVLPPAGNGMQAGFVRGPGGMGGAGLNMGGNAPQVITQEQNNQNVLDALAGLTSVNLGFDKSAWKRWYADQKKGLSLNVRRDED
jgi:hypothetical protein